MVNLQKTMDKWRQQGYTQGLDKTVTFNDVVKGFKDLQQRGIVPDVFKKPVEMFLGQEGLKEYEKQYKPQPGEYWWDNLNILNRIVNYKNGIFDAYWFNNYTDEWRKGKDMGKGGVPLIRKATQEEIEQELKRIFERLGYVGKTVKCLDDGEKRFITGKGLFIYNHKYDWCFMEQTMVYCEGKWAEIVEEDKCCGRCDGINDECIGDMDNIYSPLKVKRKEKYKVVKEEKEPELKLNEEWYGQKSLRNKLTEAKKNYEEGAKDMQKAIYERALEAFDNIYRSNPGWWNDSKTTLWESCKRKAFDAAMNGDLKPPKQ